MGNILQFARDSLTNLVSRMGTSKDKAAASYYGFEPLTDEHILVAYKTAWLPRKIVDIPSFDTSGHGETGRLADERCKQKIIDRYTLAMQGKGINGTLMLDKEEGARRHRLPHFPTSLIASCRSSPRPPTSPLPDC